MAEATTKSLSVHLWGHTHSIIGQEPARKHLASLFHRQKLIAEGKLAPRTHGVLVAGRTGVGKTHLVKNMALHSGLPFGEANATSFTDRGYIGLDLPQAFLPLISAAAKALEEQRSGLSFASEQHQGPSLFGKDPGLIKDAVALAESGVLLLDEFDKLLTQGMDQANRNVGKKLMAELLKMLEGERVYVSDSETKLGVEFDTTRTLIICAGAFSGQPPNTPSLEQCIRKRLDMLNTGYTDESLWELAEPEDFIAMGFTPELAGRLSTLVIFKPLREEHLSQILLQERGLLDEYVARFAAENCELIIENGGLLNIAGQAIQKNLGARALPFLMERICGRALFDASQYAKSKAILDVQAAQQQLVKVIPVAV